MATTASETISRESSLERWFFTFIAFEFLIIAIVGFAPTSIGIVRGTFPNPGPLIHVHAALMFAWMLGFLAQAYLIANGKVRAHIKAGQILFLVGVCILASFVYFTLFLDGEGFGRLQLPMEIERIGLFGLFLYLAFANRKRDSEGHKRYIVLATLVPLDAGLNRMPWLTSFGLPWATPVWVLILVAQLFVYDWIKLRKFHRATLLGGGLIAGFWLGITFWLLFFAGEQ